MARHLDPLIRNLLPLVIVLLWTMPVGGQQGAKNGEWRFYSGDGGSTRYSSLDQINPRNIKSLRLAWRWRADNFGTLPEYKSETTPILAGGVLYTTAGSRRTVVAIDGATGETLWTWRMDEGARWEKSPRRNSGRGVAYWSDGSEERIYVVTPGFALVALNAKTGQPVPGFGHNGVVDMMTDVIKEWGVPFDAVARIGSSSPPVVSHNVVVIGPSLEQGFHPRSKKNVPGYIMAYDARTGRQLWVFHTIPKKGEQGYETWQNGSAEYTGNAGVWAPFSVDEELGYVYLPVECATNDYYGGHRPGNNLFSTSLVCLDIRTGRRVWHYQTVHHDIWDYDNTTAPILVDIKVGGRPIKAVVQLTKQSFAFVFDRVTGKPVWPIEERPVPPSDVPGEKTSPTQPFPTKPAPFDRQGVSKDDLIDFTPELRAQALEIVKQYRLGPLYAPPSLAAASDGTKGTIYLPGAAGGALWEAGAVDPETGILYVGSSTSPTMAVLVKDPNSDADFSSGGLTVPTVQGLPLIKPPYGRITAIDLNSGLHLWMVPNGATPRDVRNHPALKGVQLPKTGSRSRAGVVVTKTLLFAGEGWGGQPMFRAYDKRTGEIVWETKLPGVQSGLPMTYLAGGKQYIALIVGDAETEHPAELIAFSLSAAPTEMADSGTASSANDGSGTENTLTAAEVAEGWTLLFDGRTFNGWTPTGSAKWRVESGTVGAVAAQGPSYLRTTRQFSNFHLKADFWGEKTANSGVFLRCPVSDSAPINQRSCYEVNIFDPHEAYPTGSVVDVKRVEGTPDTAGRWNTFEITADGTRLAVKLNGRITADTRDDKLIGGTIALQSFGSGLIKFRNVKIRPIE